MAEDSKKNNWIWVCVIVGLFAAAIVWRIAGPREIIPWRTDFASANLEAAQKGKPLFVDFTASWCGPCQSLKSTTWANEQVKAALGNYVPVQLDVDSNRELCEKYQVNSIPAFLIIDSTDDHIIRQNRHGAISTADFLAWIRG